MKKFLSVLLILSLATCMVACGEKDLPLDNDVNLLDKTTSGENVKKPVVEKYLSEEALDVYAQTQVVELPENPTTGYEWVYTIDDAEVVSVVKDEYNASENEEGLLGVGGYRICEFKGLEEGETIVYFNYIRVFEEDAEPAKSVKFYISVNANNEIAITDEVQ